MSTERLRRGMDPSELRGAFRLSYGLGIALCGVWPLVLQWMLGRTLRPGVWNAPGAVQELGYTFTGLVAISALFVLARWKKTRLAFHELAMPRRRQVLMREVLLYSATLELSALLGVLYYTLGGPQTERYARTFIALAPLMFILFVPRLAAWQKAAEETPEHQNSGG